MSFETELEAFKAYARAMPNNCVFLVDTYDTLEGVRLAIEVGRWLRDKGQQMVGIRLDSGDLAQLSIEARKLLDEAGFQECVIVASNNLDEHIISSLKDQKATISVWGVGTRLVTAFNQPALSGVYKLTAIRQPGQPWEYKLKLSEQAIKVNNPGLIQVRRYQQDGQFLADVLFDEELGAGNSGWMVDPLDSTRRLRIPVETQFSDLLEPVFRSGRCIANLPPLEVSRQRVQTQLSHLHPGIKRFLNPAEYPVGLEETLHDLKTRLILEARGTRL